MKRNHSWVVPGLFLPAADTSIAREIALFHSTGRQAPNNDITYRA
jgi:hypothetical protein